MPTFRKRTTSPPFATGLPFEGFAAVFGWRTIAQARSRVQCHEASGESPLLVGFITSISSAFAYLTVIGTPACTIVYASGYLKPKHFLKAGFRTIMISITVLVLAAYFYWPLLGL